MKRSLSTLLGVLVVVLAQSCSSHVDEPTGANGEALLGTCGVVQATVSFPWSGSTGANPLTASTRLFIPKQVTFSTNNRFFPVTGGGYVDGTLTLGGGVTCSYTVPLPSSGDTTPAFPMAFVSCSNGLSPGDEITTSSVTLSGSFSPASEDEVFTATATLGIDLDDGNPCTVDSCVNGQVQHDSSSTDGLVVDDGNPCNGTEYCSGGIAQPGTQPQAPTDSCNTWQCDPGHGGWYVSASTCSSPTLTNYAPNPTLPTDVSAEMTALFPGQTQLNTGAMDAKRLAVIRGHVLTRNPNGGTPLPLSSVKVSILDHGEFGWTTTRADGGYDIVVNGGQTYVVQFGATGYLTVQRQAETRWLDWTVLPDVILTAPEGATQVDVTGTDQLWQIVRGAQHGGGGGNEDNDGVRVATILVPPGTKISSCSGTTYCNNSTWTGQTTVNIHATEYTVGGAGPGAMPGDLPPQSGYTYAIEAGLLDSGQPIETSVTFNHPVLFYLENFTGTPLDASNVKNGVPAGSYDKTRGVWSPESSGKVYCIINTDNGVATLGIDPDCTTPLSPDQNQDYSSETPTITYGERQQIAAVYAGASKKQVWRIALPHFTGWDFNWGAGAPQGAQSPPNASPRSDQPNGHSPCDKGSIIECENQVLRESIPIVGTPYSLNYRSETQLGYHPTITVPIADGTQLNPVPARIEAEIQIAGEDVVLQGIPGLAQPQVLSWSWDRKDAYGNYVQGSATAHIEVRYVYGSVPFLLGGFGGYSKDGVGFSGNRAAREVWFSRKYDLIVGALDDERLGLGGWTISAHQVYQPASATLFRGDGTKQDPNDSPEVVHSYIMDSAGVFEDLAAAADGNIYFLHSGGSYDYLGRVQGASLAALTASGAEQAWNDGDPNSIANIHVDETTGGRNVVAEPSGSLLFSDHCRVLRVVPVAYNDLRAYLVAGDRHDACASSFAPDGAVAAKTQVAATFGLAELSDGSVLFVESYNGESRVRRIRPDGTLETLIGGGASPITSCGSSCSANAKLDTTGDALSIAARNDGTVFLFDGRVGLNSNRVWQLFPRDGQLYVFAGNGTYGATGDGLPGSSFLPTSTDSSVELAGSLDSFLSVAGSRVFIPSYGGDYAARQVNPDGTITRFAGTYGVQAPYADGLFASETPLRTKRVVLSPDDYYYTTGNAEPSNGAANRIVRFRRGDDTPSGTDILVPSSDGSEVYEFDSTGKHLYTRSRYSGATAAGVILDLATGCNGGPCYDGQGRVTALPDHLRGTTTLTYGSGTVTIAAPTGQQTTLTLTGGYLTDVQDPAGKHTQLAYDAHGMLSQLTEPVAANVHYFAYSATGLLVKDVAPGAGAGTRLSRLDNASSFGIDLSTAESRTTSHDVDMSVTSDTFTDVTPSQNQFTRRERRRRTTLASSNPTDDTWYTDSSHVHSSPDGTTTSTSYAPDPRFGMNLAYVSALTTTTPGHAGSGQKCVYGWHGMCELRKRTADGTGFSATTVTDERWGTFNDYGTHETNQWTSAPTVDCASPPCIVRTSSEGRKTIYNLDGHDRVTQVSVSGIDPITINYGQLTENLGKVVSVVQGTRTYATHYTSTSPYAGFVDGLDTPLLASPTHTVTFGSLDLDGRVKTQTFEGNTSRVVNMDYDDNGNRIWLKEPNDPSGSSYQHNFTYNGLNLLSSYQPPPVGYSNTTYDYDLDGLLRDTFPPTANMVTNVRDGAGRVTQISYAHPVSGTVTVTMGYDPAMGQICTANGGRCTASNGTASSAVDTVTTTDTYDGYLLTQEQTQMPTLSNFNHTIYWNYEDSLRLHERYIDAPNFSDTVFHYDHDSLVSSLDVQSGPYTIWRYPNGAVQCATIGSVCETYQYDEYGALIDQNDVAGSCTSSCSPTGTTILHIVYTRNDPVGRVTSKSETANATPCNWSYSYGAYSPEWLDSSSRSGSTYCTGSTPITYDPDGNIKTGLYTSGSVNVQDQLTADGASSFTYDAQGNLASLSLSGGHYAYYSYDPVGNLRHFANNLTNVTLDYDVDFRNRRVGKVRNNVFSEGYLYDGDRVAAWLGSAGNVSAVYVYVTKPNVPDLILVSGTTYRVISDQIGSVRRIVNVANGTTLAGQDLSFDAYGAAKTWLTPTANFPGSWHPFGFAGGLWDADAGLYRFGQRDYSAAKGRWMQKDPIGFGGGLNLYAYCGNDPVNCTDPRGTFPWAAAGAGAGGAAALFGAATEGAEAGAPFGPAGVVLGAALAAGVAYAIYESEPCHTVGWHSEAPLEVSRPKEKDKSKKKCPNCLCHYNGGTRNGGYSTHMNASSEAKCAEYCSSADSYTCN